MATLNVFSAGAAQAVVSQIAEKFQHESANIVNAAYGAVGAMKTRVVAGEPADVIVLTAALIDELCETAEGYVHRLWEPLDSKHRPANDYAAKFSTPFNIAVAFVTGSAGLEAFSEKTVRDPRILALASKVRYAVDPDNPYPKAFTGHVRMTLEDGRVFAERQPHIRGGHARPAVACRHRAQVPRQRRLRRMAA